MEFRTLRADEIEVRVGSISKKGATLLLYKDARCDMNILDETVGMMNWQRHHSRDNANCTVSIWDDDKRQWIEKEDTGTESFTEKEKGLASDSFKRACFNLGIGRELYTAPRIFILCDTKPKSSGRGYELSDPFTFYGVSVSNIEYDGRKVSALTLEKNGNVIYSFNGGKAKSSKVASEATETTQKTQADMETQLQKQENLKLLMLTIRQLLLLQQQMQVRM